jgi:hypothetical protein
VRIEQRSAMTDYATESGGRQPAVAGQTRIRRHEPYWSADRRRCVWGRRCIRVYRRHGGLTPPALVLRCERLPAKQRFLRCTNVCSTKSGGREPAVAGQTASATAMRGISACRFAFREHTTGGLRPPLLCCSANVCRRNNDFCDAQTYIRPGAAGVSQPWVSVSQLQRRFH